MLEIDSTRDFYLPASVSSWAKQGITWEGVVLTASLHELTFHFQFPVLPSVTSDWIIFPATIPWSHPHSLLPWLQWCLSYFPSCQCNPSPWWICCFMFLWLVYQLNEWDCSKRFCPESKPLLSAAGQQSPIIAIEPHSAAVRVGESASFKCNVYSGAQPVRLEWKLASNKPLPGNYCAQTAFKEQNLLNNYWFYDIIIYNQLQLQFTLHNIFYVLSLILNFIQGAFEKASFLL